MSDMREVLYFTSYCGGDNPDCSDKRPCPVCLGMSNVYSIPADLPATYVRQLAAEWNSADSAADHIADYLEGMAENARNHGYIDASSFHAAYEQALREAIVAIRSGAAIRKGTP
jgi:hypothetical protein